MTTKADEILSQSDRMDGSQTREGSEESRLLLKLAQDRSLEGRKALVNSISDMFSERASKLTEREHALMNDILAKLVFEFEMSVRQELSERLAAKESAPHDLIVALANDEIEVARPVLSQSTVLQTPELVEIIKNRTRQHQLAIAMRRSVDEIISDALVETGHSDVITALLQNPNAQITEATLVYLVDEARRVDSYQEPLVRRRDLPPALARKMSLWVSAALRSHILENFDIAPTDLDDELEAVSDAAAGAQVEAEEELQAPAEALAQHLVAHNAVNPDILIQTLRRGEISLFEALFGQTSGLTSPRLQRVLYEPSGKDLAIACRALGIGRSHFSVLFLLTRKGVGGREVADPRDVARVMSYYDQMNLDGACQVLKQWQRRADYLEAIEEIEEKRNGSSPG